MNFQSHLGMTWRWDLCSKSYHPILHSYETPPLYGPDYIEIPCFEHFILRGWDYLVRQLSYQKSDTNPSTCQFVMTEMIILIDFPMISWRGLFPLRAAMAQVTLPTNWQWPIYGLEGVERLERITESFMLSCRGLQVGNCHGGTGLVNVPFVGFKFS